MTDVVLTEADADGVLTVTINRPEVKNAINHEVAEGIAEAMDRLDNDDSLTVGILTGAGDTFSAGMDLKGFLAGNKPTLPGRGFGGLTEKPPAKPLIAAVEGWALAGGFELALASDIIVASTSARFGLPEVKRSLVAAAGGLLRLPKTLPYSVVMTMALTGDPLTADEAHRHGLLSELTEAGGALEAAHHLARRIAANGPLAVRATKEIIAKQAAWTQIEAFEDGRTVASPVFASADAQEGALAFREKRAPVWLGR
ncbi:crotonase/enoyl-CoA hydratase family protein [Aeromicrobium sp. Leaf350]|uniref:crotonase/enoyl-CoA hydratase family protein n=1 Tax=Aeromicrobium sp. Leaf350 TaxID=2876565 RepID=UPI001E50DF39|nr:crotonase/enoyl-CoA hydratase family protein [Aeromicrobium sp. Leaf350]